MRKKEEIIARLDKINSTGSFASSEYEMAVLEVQIDTRDALTKISDVMLWNAGHPKRN